MQIWELRGFFQNGLDAVGGPEQVFLLDGEGWGETDDVVVGLFAEDAFAHKGFADGAGGAVELDRDPEAAAADFADVGALDLLEAVEEEGAEFGGAVGEALFNDDFE